MNRRETIGLGVILVLVLVAAIGYFQTRSAPPERIAPPFFYEIEASDIIGVQVEQGDLVESFAWDEEAGLWRFDDETKESPDEERWGGMPVLLAGPRIERTLPGGLNLGDLGLDPPMTTVTIGLETGGEFRVHIGRPTPDSSAHYVRQSNNDAVFLVSAAWGDVISRLATDPPRLPPPGADAP